MALPIAFSNQTYAAGFFGTDDGGAPTNATHSFRIDDVYNFPVTVNGTVSGPTSTVTLTYTLPGATSPTTQTLTATPYDNSTMILFTGSGVPGTQDGTTNRYVFSNTQLFGTGDPNRTTFADDSNNPQGAYAIPACYVTGTRILAVRDGIVGGIVVEDLREGDLAVTASGAHRSIRWIGQRAYSGIFANRNPDLLPVRFAAGSLGDNVPSRDLCVSPKHAMVLDGMLVPAEHLVNGTSITRTRRVESLEYFHVELDSHDVLLAEGAESESYVEDGNRQFFHNAAAYRAANPGAEILEAAYCLPRLENGFALETIRQRLALRGLAARNEAA